MTSAWRLGVGLAAILTAAPAAAQTAPRQPARFATTTTLVAEQQISPPSGALTVAAIALVALQAVAMARLLRQRAKRREIEARDAAMLGAVPDLMFVQDRDGVYLDFHAPDPGGLLVPPGEFLGRSLRDVLPSPAREVVSSLFERAWQIDEPVVGEYSLDIGGTARRFEVRLARCGIDRMLSVVRDITDRARMQAALVASEQRYALATAAGRLGVWDLNLESGDMFIDPRLKAILGFEDHEIANRIADWLRHMHPDDEALVASRTQPCIDGKTSGFEVEHRMLHKDGSIRWFLGRGSLVRVAGEPPRLVGTDTDISGQKQADEALHLAQRDLEHISRVAALGEFGASIAHEVSQPLTAIVMNARTCLHWLGEASPNLEDIRATLMEVVDAGMRADAIIRRTRELFKHHTVEMRPLDINDLIHEVTALAAARLGAGRVRLEQTLARGLPPVLGDRIELSQVLLNLFANGIDAMEEMGEGSRIMTVTSEHAPDGWVQVSVRDAGVGLGDVDVARMFNASYTTKARGTGVGLSISRTIIEAHGGRLWATANDGAGATFAFVVPALPHD